MHFSNTPYLPHIELKMDGEKYTTMSHPRSPWMPLLPILMRNRNNQKCHKFSLPPSPSTYGPPSVSTWLLSILFLSMNCMWSYHNQHPICVLHSISSNIVKDISLAILLSLFCPINCFPPCCIIPISISLCCYFIHFTKQNKTPRFFWHHFTFHHVSTLLYRKASCKSYLPLLTHSSPTSVS